MGTCLSTALELYHSAIVHYHSLALTSASYRWQSKDAKNWCDFWKIRENLCQKWTTLYLHGILNINILNIFNIYFKYFVKTSVKILLKRYLLINNIPYHQIEVREEDLETLLVFHAGEISHEPKINVSLFFFFFLLSSSTMKPSWNNSSSSDESIFQMNDNLLAFSFQVKTSVSCRSSASYC